MSCVFINSFDSDPRGPYTSASEPLHAGPRAWRWLHLKALDGELTKALLASFTNCVSCPDCRRHFMQIQQEMPFDERNQFAWSVKAHNAVNRSRGVPTMGVEDARKMWTGPRTSIVSSERVVPKASDAIVAAI